MEISTGEIEELLNDQLRLKKIHCLFLSGLEEQLLLAATLHLLTAQQ